MLITALITSLLMEYDRRDWGGWIDTDRDCQNTRVEIIEDYSVPPYKPTCRATGKVFDLYSDSPIDVNRADIDHVVALKDAFRSGGWQWTHDERIQYANSINHILPVDLSLNRSKGDQTLGEWLPPKRKCDYVIRYSEIKRENGLTNTPLDTNIINICSMAQGYVYTFLPSSVELDHLLLIGKVKRFINTARELSLTEIAYLEDSVARIVSSHWDNRYSALATTTSTGYQIILTYRYIVNDNDLENPFPSHQHPAHRVATVESFPFIINLQP